FRRSELHQRCRHRSERRPDHLASLICSAAVVTHLTRRSGSRMLALPREGGGMLTRRDFLQATAGGVAAAALTTLRPATVLAADPPGFNALPAGTTAGPTLEALPGKLPLIKRSFRPPNYETPVEYFNEPLTQNRAFFVRYHLSSIPEVSASDWK